jgi:ActR/RegA family two-component response regulator
MRRAIGDTVPGKSFMSNQILIVSDVLKQREAIHRQANRAGFADREIVEAIDEASAYDKIKTNEFQAAVIDLCLITGENDPRPGLRVIKALHEEEPACRIVALTAFAEDSGSDAIRAGANDFIFMGWEYIEWTELLRNLLTLWRKASPRTFAVR